MNRPTHKALLGKLRKAVAAFDANPARYVAVGKAPGRHVPSDMAELEVSEPDYWDIVYDCLILAIEDPLNCFRQPEPPKATKDEIKNLPMWAFVVKHQDFHRRLYFKFCLQELNGQTWYKHIDCHYDRKDNT